MVTIFQPLYKLTINGFDVTTSVEPYILNISLEDVFDLDFTVSKLDITFHAKYRRSLAWQYKDQLKIELWWSTRPLFKLVSGVFYIDFVSDVKNQGGIQTFTVSALEANPDLGFTYGVDELVYTAKTIRDAVFEFRDLFGLTLTHNLDLDVFMGNNDISQGDIPVIKFNSYIEMLRYICKTFGYFGNLSGNKLELIKILSDTSGIPRFYMYPLSDIFNFDYRQTYNNFAKTYRAYFLDSGTFTIMNYQLPMQAQLNNKTRVLEQDKVYYNNQTAAARVYGEAFADIIKSFELTIRCFGLPEFAAGNVFLLDSSYGSAGGYYRCTSVRHSIDASGWNAEVKGFPLDFLNQTAATFKLGYTGRYENPSTQINISDTLTGVIDTTVLTGTMLDNYAKYLNPNYNQNLGSIFITEGNKPGNTIRADLAFGIALVMTNNFTIPLLNTRFNPGDLRTTLGGSTVATFSSWTIGIRALIQRLFGYSRTSGSPHDTIVDPAFNSIPRGSRLDLFDLNGVYSSNTDWYGLVTNRVKYLYELNYPKNTYSVF